MLKSKKGDVAYATDEHFRPNCKLEAQFAVDPETRLLWRANRVQRTSLGIRMNY